MILKLCLMQTAENAVPTEAPAEIEVPTEDTD